MKTYNCIPCSNWPGKLGFCTITRCISEPEEMLIFQEQLTQATEAGNTILSCGINGSSTDVLLAWAILAAKVISESKEEQDGSRSDNSGN